MANCIWLWCHNVICFFFVVICFVFSSVQSALWYLNSRNSVLYSNHFFSKRHWSTIKPTLLYIESFIHYISIYFLPICPRDTFWWGFPSDSAVKNSPATPRLRRHGFDPWVRKVSWRRKQQPTPVFLPGESQGQRSPAGYRPWGCKKSDSTEWLSMYVHHDALLHFLYH